MTKDSKKIERSLEKNTKKPIPALARKSKMVQTAKSASYQNYLIESLKNPKEAAGYLNAALMGGDLKVFLLALQNVVQAQGGISSLAERTHKSRTSLYKSLSEEGNPYLKSAHELLIAMGMQFAIVQNKKTTS